MSKRQSCKAWLLSNILPSSKRVGILGRYLVSLSKALSVSKTTNGDNSNRGRGDIRRRLHILYLLNDFLHHAKYHGPSPSQFYSLSSAIQPFIADLVRPAGGGSRPRTRTRIVKLLQVWEEEDYFDKAFVGRVREVALKETSDPGPDKSVAVDRAADAKEQSYLMPASHGDPSIPYYDLPAGNMMPHIMPNESVPIRSADFRALQLSAGPADETLVIALKDFMAAAGEIEHASGEMWGRDDYVEDMDELGQPLSRDQTGELRTGRTYYGWSYDFCDRMKSRNAKKELRRGRGSSLSSSRSRSRSGRKKGRYSDSSRSRSSSPYARSRSRNQLRQSHLGNGRRDDRSSSGGEYGEGRSRSRSRSYSPSFEPTLISEQLQSSTRPGEFHHDPSQDGRPPFHPHGAGVSMNPPNAEFPIYPFPPFMQNHGSGPVPPPRPANYAGPWPPPPPPLPPHRAPNQHLPMPAFPMPQEFSGQTPHQWQQQHYGSSGWSGGRR